MRLYLQYDGYLIESFMSYGTAKVEYTVTDEIGSV